VIFPGSSYPSWHLIFQVCSSPSWHIIFFLVRRTSSFSRDDRRERSTSALLALSIDCDFRHQNNAGSNMFRLIHHIQFLGGVSRSRCSHATGPSSSSGWQMLFFSIHWDSPFPRKCLHQVGHVHQSYFWATLW
jgi:hypothetical protein